ncbi:hypothetical protein IWW36_004382 [Coemansia brasiliensis]|uniref:Rab-GAP TBC domain-containing protein n=1 Tax=Coemansia brasiliensis TaxID=2650707 RepID=A0A9W8I9U5_9FUNG|nr:hypothetical protein IWW36_004382 [Coemansia brasiliensis]
MDARLADFDYALFGNEACVDVRRLAELSFGGIPDVPGLRALCWRLLLGVLPPTRSQWRPALAAARTAYADAAHAISHDNGPEARALLAQIRADVHRTLPDIALFRARPVDPQRLACERRGLSERVAAAINAPFVALNGNSWLLQRAQTHADAVARVLFVHARFNRGAGYAQGMNDVLAPLYYVLASVHGDCEADAFQMLTYILRGPHLDVFAARSLKRTLAQWWQGRVHSADAQLWTHLNEMGLRPEHFAVRWMLVAGAREFALPDVLVLWDALLADRARLVAPLPLLSTQLRCALRPTHMHRAIRLQIGRLSCETHFLTGISGDDADLAPLGFLFDFFTAVLLALRPQLMLVPLDACIALLQHLPREDSVLEMRCLIDATLALRSDRAAVRAVRSCSAVLATAPRRSGSNISAIAPLLVPNAEYVSSGSDYETLQRPAELVSRLLGQLSSKLGFRTPPLSPAAGTGVSNPIPATPPPTPQSAALDCLILAIPRQHSTMALHSDVVASAINVYEVRSFDPQVLEATVRQLGECDAVNPSLASVQIPASNTADICVPLAELGIPKRQHRRTSDGSSSISSSITAADDRIAPPSRWPSDRFKSPTWHQTALIELCDSDSDS